MNPYSLLCIKPDFVPPSITQTLLSNKSSDYSEALVGYDDSQTVTDHRKTKWLTLPSDVHANLYRTIYQIHEQHLMPVYDSTAVHVEPPQFLRYDVDEHYDVHNDSESWVNGRLQRVVERDISVLLYLNDDYEGGQIEFTKLGLTLKPKSGMLLAFPSYLEFEHKVHPVTKGVRYTIVSWIATEKRIYARPYDTPTDLRGAWVPRAQQLRAEALR